MFDYQNGGFYAVHVQRYFDMFGRDRVLVLMFEDMTADMTAARASLNEFLGITLPDGDMPRMNAGGRRSPVLRTLLGDERLKAGLRNVLPLGLRTRISGRLQNSVATEKPRMSDTMRDVVGRRFAGDTAELERLLGRSTGWPSA